MSMQSRETTNKKKSGKYCVAKNKNKVNKYPLS